VIPKTLPIVTASTGATVSFVTENVVLFLLATTCAIIGWLFTQKIASLDRQNARVEAKLEENMSLLNRILGSMDYQDSRIKEWHGDREEIFERLRAVETRASVIETNCIKQHKS